MWIDHTFCNCCWTKRTKTCKWRTIWCIFYCNTTISITFTFSFKTYFKCTTNGMAQTITGFIQRKKSMAKPLTCGTIATNISKTFIMFTIRSTKWYFFNGLFNKQTLLSVFKISKQICMSQKNHTRFNLSTTRIASPKTYKTAFLHCSFF